MIKKNLGILFLSAIVLLICLAPVKTFAEPVVDACDNLSGSNIESQDYNNWSCPIMSYFVKAEDGYMRVQAGRYVDDIAVEYYNEDLIRVDKLTVPEELPEFGGFYETENNYFIVSGQLNEDECDDVEVFRVTKYDKKWNRIGSCGLYGANTTEPFGGASCRMDYSEGWLVVRTGHIMYTSSDDLRHQANVTFLVDTVNMEITDASTDVSWNGTGYASHSFNQFVKLEDNKIVAVDHGDAYPRAAALFNYPTDITTGTFATDDCQMTYLFEFEGYGGDNRTGASIGGFEMTDDKYILAGNSIIQDENYQSRNTKNIFVVSSDKKTKETSVTWLTSYPEGDESIYESTSTPHMVRVSETEFMVLWTRYGMVNYCIVDETGKLISEIFSHEGALSDCVPLVDEDEIIWYTWDDKEMVFYTIDLACLNELRVDKKYYEHEMSDDYTFDDCEVTFTCTKCKEVITGTTPYMYLVTWSYNNDINGDYEFDPEQLDFDKPSYLHITKTVADFEEMVIEFEDPEVADISRIEEETYIIKWKKEGKTTIRVYPKYAPSDKKTFEIWIGEIPISVHKNRVMLMKTDSIEYTSNNPYVYDGKSKKPIVYVVKENHELLEEGRDYTVSYKNNVDAGTATAVITGVGNYKGVIYKDFKINKKSISSKTVNIPYKSYSYTGKTIAPKVSIKGLAEGTDFSVSYTDNKKVGKAVIKVSGKGNYKGTKTKTFNINPKATVISGLKSGKQQITVMWKTCLVQVDGYQVRYGTVKNFTSYKAKNVESRLKGNLKLTGLKSNQKYWVKVRTYKTVKGVKYYSAWSEAKPVKTK